MLKMKSILLTIVLVLVIAFGASIFQSKPKMEMIRIPIEFLSQRGSSCIGSSCINIEIEGNPFLLALDTGASGEFVLRNSAIQKAVNRKFVGQCVEIDIKGNERKKSVFKFDVINVANCVCANDVLVEEETLEFITEGSHINLGEETAEEIEAEREYLERISGRIGIHALRRLSHCILDFRDSSLIWIKNVDKKFNFQGAKVEWEEFWGGMLVIPVETDFGLKKFVLDTGADYTIIRPTNLENNHEVLMSKKFIIAGSDLGPTELAVYAFSSKFSEFDGILGRDFFLKHAVCLDFKNKTALIGPKRVTDSIKGPI